MLMLKKLYYVGLAALLASGPGERAIAAEFDPETQLDGRASVDVSAFLRMSVCAYLKHQILTLDE